MDLHLKEFESWAKERITLKHNWFDRLADVARNSPLGGSLPPSLTHWGDRMPELRDWLRQAVSALSPRQVLDLPAFDFGDEAATEAFRNHYKEWLHERYLNSPARVHEIVADCLDKLKELDKELTPMLPPDGPVLTDARRASIVSQLEYLARRMRDLPERVRWPERVEDTLPRILVIDDLLGRATAARDGVTELKPQAQSELLELRRSFCERFHLVDNDFAHPLSQPKAIARAHFSSGQSYDPVKGFVNDLRVVEGAVGADKSARPWVLVIADILFNTGTLNDDGRGSGESRFGITGVIPWLRAHADEIPVVALTTESGRNLIEEVHEQGVEYLHRSESSYADLLVRIARGGRAKPPQLRRAMNVPDDFVTEDPRMLEVLLDAWSIAQDDGGRSVLITGESGSGKERLAQFIHDSSPRAARPLIFVNCAQYSKELADSELFGYYANAFTGASSADTPGIFQEAHGGTLVLDEFADLDRDVQVKLLRTLEPKRAQHRPVEPRGNRRPNSKLRTEVDVRVICCTNQPLGQVRRDLRTRVSKVIGIPPLRERPDDIVPLARYFLSHPKRIGRPGLVLDDGAEEFIRRNDLPGNARTLEHLLEVVAVGKGRHNIIRREELRRAWKSVARDAGAGDGAGDAIRATAFPRDEAAPQYGPLGHAVATLLATARREKGWEQMSKVELEELDEALQGNVLEVLSVLVEWSLFRAGDAPGVASYITGRRAKGRTPEDLVKRLLKLDQRVQEGISNSDRLPPNTRLREIIESCGREWERRSKSAPDE